MRFGKPIIRRCTHCDGLIEEQTMMSGNTMGARLWTDGKFIALMMLQTPALVGCPHCKQRLRLDEQEVLQSFAINVAKLRKRTIARYDTLNADDYFAELAEQKCTPEDERYLRLNVWWEANRPRRFEEHSKPLSQTERDNLNALSQLLDTREPCDRLLAAEIQRELGNFDAALELAEGEFEGQLQRAANAIRVLAEQGDVVVREIRLEN